MSSEVPGSVQRLREIDSSIWWDDGSKGTNYRGECSRLFGEMLASDDKRVVGEACALVEDWLTNMRRGSWVCDFAGHILMQNWDKLVGRVNDEEQDRSRMWMVLGLMDSYEVFSPLLGDEYRAKAGEAKEILARIIPERGGVIQDLDTMEGYRYIPLLKRHGSAEQRQSIGPWLELRLDEATYFSNVLDMGEREMILARLFDRNGYSWLSDEVRTYVKKMGVDLYRVDEYWRKPDTDENSESLTRGPIGRYVLRNLLAMREAERWEKGSVGRLHKFNGIVHFGSWPLDILRTQLTKDMGSDRPVIFLSMAVDNYNGSGWDNHEFFNKIFQQFGEEYDLVVGEIEPENGNIHQETAGMSQYQIFDHRTGSLIADREVPLVWMLVHGGKDGMNYSNRNVGKIKADDFMSNQGGAMLATMTDEGLLILASCSTGTLEQDGIGRWLSSMSGKRVVGPQEPASYIVLELTEFGGRFDIGNIEAKDRNKRTVRVSVFQDGELVREF